MNNTQKTQKFTVRAVLKFEATLEEIREWYAFDSSVEMSDILEKLKGTLVNDMSLEHEGEFSFFFENERIEIPAWFGSKERDKFNKEYRNQQIIGKLLEGVEYDD